VSKYYGDFRAGQVIRAAFNTVNASAVPTTLSSPSFVVTKDGAVVTPTGGVTLTPDADSIAGFNRLAIDTSTDAATFAAGSDYKVRLGGAANVGGVSVVGSVVAEFSIQNRAIAIDTLGRLLLQPTQTGVTIPAVTSVGTLTTYTGNTPQSGDAFARLGTPAGASIAADIATRSTYAGGPVASVTAPVTAGAVTDKTGYSLAQAFPAGFATLAIASGKVAATVAAGDNADSAAIKATIGIAGAGLTALGDARLANLDATVSSRLATSSYTAPPAVPTAVTVGGYMTGQDPATLVWAATTKALTDKAGFALISAYDQAKVNPWTIDIIGTSYVAGTAGSIMAGDRDFDGIATAGTTTTITLAADEIDASSRSILINGGTGAKQGRSISAYNPTTRIATLNRPWLVVPDATSRYILGPPTDGYSLATAPPTPAAISSAVVAGMANAPVGSVANLVGVALDGGSVSASPAPTTITFSSASSNLHAPAGGYTVAPMSVLWQTGPNQGMRFPITGHSVSGGVHAFTVAAMPVAPVGTPTPDTFVIA
jgi:hypothetical protein